LRKVQSEAKSVELAHGFRDDEYYNIIISELTFFKKIFPCLCSSASLILSTFGDFVFGYLRFFLACLVLVNHSPYCLLPFDLAVSAVVIFYMISGYTMGIKFTRYQRTSRQPILTFCVDRLLRVFPLYFYFLTLSVIGVYIFGSARDIELKLNMLTLIQNYTLVPMNYYMFTGEPILIPNAYSLALEEQFYLLMPFLLTFTWLVRPTIIFSGLVILGSLGMVIANIDYGIGRLFDDFTIYRLLPGVLIVFLLGISLDKNNLKFAGLGKKIYLFFCVLFLSCIMGGLMRNGQVMAVTLGVLVGTPLIHYLKELPRHDLDEAFGNLSYGIFLGQSLIYFLMGRAMDFFDIHIKSTRKFTLDFQWQEVAFNFSAFILTIIIAYISFKLIGRPARGLRVRVVKYLLNRFPHLNH
jgi:peptidoglycan/LPS O-acetylase OafA/YrhL